jgi:hypothetical protein
MGVGAAVARADQLAFASLWEAPTNILLHLEIFVKHKSSFQIPFKISLTLNSHQADYTLKIIFQQKSLKNFA